MVSYLFWFYALCWQVTRWWELRTETKLSKMVFGFFSLTKTGRYELTIDFQVSWMRCGITWSSIFWIDSSTPSKHKKLKKTSDTCFLSWLMICMARRVTKYQRAVFLSNHNFLNFFFSFFFLGGRQMYLNSCFYMTQIIFNKYYSLNDQLEYCI